MSATQYKPKNVFAKYGHNDCSMPEELEEVRKKYPGTSTSAKIKRCWASLFLVSEEMCRSISSHLKSHGVVVNEQERQLNHKNCIIHPYSSFSRKVGISLLRWQNLLVLKIEKILKNVCLQADCQRCRGNAIATIGDILKIKKEMSATQYKPKNVFAKYGHNDCSMPEELEEVRKKYPGTSTSAKIKRCWASLFLVSEEMCRSISSHLKSHGAVVNEQERQLNHKYCIIHPYSSFRFYWDLVMIVVSYVQLILAPVDAMLYILPNTFPLNNGSPFTIFRMSMDLTCVLDVILNFFTGFYDETEKRVSFKYWPIAKHYLKGDFVIDALASMPTQVELFVDLQVDGWVCNLCSGLSLLKILRYIILEKLFTKVCNIKRVNYYVRQAIVIGISITLFWLILSSVHFFSIITMGQRQEWYRRDQAGEVEQVLFFVEHIYNGAILINNVSFGLYKPKDNWNLLNRVAFWSISRVVLIYILARVIEFMNAKTAATRKYKRIVQLLSEFMRHKGLPLITQMKILRFYEYHYQMSFYNEKEIMATISGQLRQELVMHNCRQLVENVKFFKSLPLAVLVRIVSFLHSETYMINDVICRANTIGNCMYFISSGTVAVYTKSGKEICHLHEGDYFGEVALVTDGAVRVATVLGVEVCEVYRLERADFIRAIHPYPDLLQMIRKVALERREDALEIDVKYRRQYDGAV